MDSKSYWKNREEENLRSNLKEEEEYVKEINRIYDRMMVQITKEINDFYVRYAKKEGISISEARKRVKKLDINAYAEKAKKYVKEKDFSDEANEEMRLYNLTMKVNRLELLKAQIGLELVDNFNDLQKYFDEKLTKRTLDEFKRQAGILGKTLLDNEKAAHAVVNASFHNATFSDRIWLYQGLLKNDLYKLLQIGIVQGKNPRVLAAELVKKFDVSRYNAERLMRTELARVQTEAQRQSFERNGYDEYEYIACGKSDVCDICKALDGKHFKVKDMMVGENAPPMHPMCHCSVAAHMDRGEHEAWLDYLDKGGTTEEWKRLRKQNMDDKDSNKGKRREELIKRSSEYAKIVQKYSTRKSKWSGNTVLDDEKCKRENISGRKLWSCDILLRTNCQDRTIIHEHLHACSGSYLNPLSIIQYKNIEEASVELLAREICKEEAIAFKPNRNHKVDYLYELNHKLNICDTDLDFAVALFAKSIKTRYNWLNKQVRKHMDSMGISKEEKEHLMMLVKKLEGY